LIVRIDVEAIPNPLALFPRRGVIMAAATKRAPVITELQVALLGSLSMSRRLRGPRVATIALALALGLGGAASPGASEAPVKGADSADRMIFWLDCDRIVKLTDTELDEWKSRGVDGFVCMVGHLRGLGGKQDFSGDPAAKLRQSRYALQRRLRNSDIVGRAKARGMKMYLGSYLVNYYNQATPLSDWFDDAGWSKAILPKIGDLAGAAKLLGFAGLAFDQELYPQEDNVEAASWDWDYPGNTHTEREVRAAAKQRGSEVMSTILDAFPGVELVAYDVELPEGWEALVQGVVNGESDAFASRLDIDFWDGLTSVDGYGAIRLIDAIFYKSAHIGSWDSALQYNANRLAGLLSRRLSNWDYAASRVFLSPFSWIDPGPSTGDFDDARPPSDVGDQLLAFRKWGMGGEFANYVWNENLGTFDYSPYVGAMQEASTPAVVDSQAPTLEISSARPAGRRTRVEGIARDNLAVWAIRWRDDRGAHGAARSWAQLAYDPASGDAWETGWSFPGADLSPGATRVRITATDIKGHRTTRWLHVSAT
jgi:hypothetical protein